MDVLVFTAISCWSDDASALELSSSSSDSSYSIMRKIRAFSSSLTCSSSITLVCFFSPSLTPIKVIYFCSIDTPAVNDRKAYAWYALSFSRVGLVYSASLSEPPSSSLLNKVSLTAFATPSKLSPTTSLTCCAIFETIDT